MTETFQKRGLCLDFEQVQAILAWWDHETTIVPSTVEKSAAHEMCVKGVWVHLNPTLIEEMRDWAYPWEAVDPDTCVGERGRVFHEGDGGRVMQNRVFAADDGAMITLKARHVWVRRPRIVRVRLGDVPNGLVVRDGRGEERRTLAEHEFDSREVGLRRVLDESTWLTDLWLESTLVEIVEDGK